jgi:hypothetical protein
VAIDMKNCIKCKEVKSLDSFHKHKQMKDGHLNKCAVCVLQDVTTWRNANPNCRKQEHIKNREKLGLKTREEWIKFKKENAIGRKVSASKYSHKRRLQTEQTNMTEFDKFVEEEALMLCELREKVTSFKWNLDHIVPLNFKDACGLHTYSNFQVVPASWNFKKGNRNMNIYNNALTGY